MLQRAKNWFITWFGRGSNPECGIIRHSIAMVLMAIVGIYWYGLLLVVMALTFPFRLIIGPLPGERQL